MQLQHEDTATDHKVKGRLHFLPLPWTQNFGPWCPVLQTISRQREAASTKASSRLTRRRQVAVPGASPMWRHWLVCWLLLSSAVLSYSVQFLVFKVKFQLLDSGLESCPDEVHQAVVMAFRSFISPSRWAISLVSSSGS